MNARKSTSCLYVLQRGRKKQAVIIFNKNGVQQQLLLLLVLLLLLLLFDVLLTVHLSIFISVINQLDAQNFCFTPIGVMIPEAV